MQGEGICTEGEVVALFVIGFLIFVIIGTIRSYPYAAWQRSASFADTSAICVLTYIVESARTRHRQACDYLRRRRVTGDGRLHTMRSGISTGYLLKVRNTIQLMRNYIQYSTQS